MKPETKNLLLILAAVVAFIALLLWLIENVF